VTHTKIRPHTSTNNVEIEPYYRAIGKRIGEENLEDLTQTKALIIGAYNHVRNLTRHLSNMRL